MLKTPSQSSVSTTRVEKRRKSRQKTHTLFAAHLSLSNVRNPYTKHSGKASEKLYKHSQKVTWRPQTCCCSAKRFQNNSFCSRRFTKVLQTVGNDQNHIPNVFGCPRHRCKQSLNICTHWKGSSNVPVGLHAVFKQVVWSLRSSVPLNFSTSHPLSKLTCHLEQ